MPTYPLPAAFLLGKREGGRREGMIAAIFVFGDCAFARAKRRPI